jgi:hypothetical protein
VPVSAERGTDLDALEGVIAGAAAAVAAAVSGGRRHRSRRALPRGRVHPRKDLPPAGRRGALRDDRRDRRFDLEARCGGSTRRCTSTRASQRAILLLRGGTRMKAIASQARPTWTSVRRPRLSRACGSRSSAGWGDSDAGSGAARLLRAPGDGEQLREPPRRRAGFVLHTYPYRETT